MFMSCSGKKASLVKSKDPLDLREEKKSKKSFHV